MSRFYRASLVALCLLLGGCATYTSKVRDLRPELIAGDYDAALTTVAAENGSRDRLLAALERGLILHYADRPRQSNQAFALAERLAEDLYTRSIFEGAMSLVSNDNAISYRARPFEMAMVPYFKSLNYIALGEPHEAVVEARRTSEVLSAYTQASLVDLPEAETATLALINNNAFAHYFSGMLYDWDGDSNAAFISYRNAAEAYQQSFGLLQVEIPPHLADDLQRLASQLGFGAELAELRRSCPDVFAAATGSGGDSGHGEVVLLLESGFVTQKTEIRFSFPVFAGETYADPDYWSWQIWAALGDMHAFVQGREVEYWVAAVVPTLPPPPVAASGGGLRARVRVAGTEKWLNTTRVANLDRQTRLVFETEKPAIYFKTILRGLTKYLASRGADKLAGKWAQLAVNLFGAATESADTRSWLTLPGHISLGRLSLPAGQYDLQVDLLSAAGDLLTTQTITDVEVRRGDWVFVSRRVY